MMWRHGTAEVVTSKDKYERLVEILTEARNIAGSLRTSTDHIALVSGLIHAKALAVQLNNEAPR